MATKTPTKKKAEAKKKKATSVPVQKRVSKRSAIKKSNAITAVSAVTPKKVTTRRAVKATDKKSGVAATKKSTHHKTKGAALKKLAHSSRTRATAVTKKAIADEHECFWVNNGPVVRDLAELARAMHEISDDQFWHHVRPEQNDFARWVEDVFGEPVLARKIERTKSRTGTYRVVVAHVSLGS